MKKPFSKEGFPRRFFEVPCSQESMVFNENLPHRVLTNYIGKLLIKSNYKAKIAQYALIQYFLAEYFSGSEGHL